VSRGRAILLCWGINTYIYWQELVLVVIREASTKWWAIGPTQIAEQNERLKRGFVFAQICAGPIDHTIAAAGVWRNKQNFAAKTNNILKAGERLLPNSRINCCRKTFQANKFSHLKT
jgi:hypothetical protein